MTFKCLHAGYVDFYLYIPAWGLGNIRGQSVLDIRILTFLIQIKFAHQWNKLISKNQFSDIY